MCTLLRKSLILLILYNRQLWEKSVLEVYFDVLFPEISKLDALVVTPLVFCGQSPHAPPFAMKPETITAALATLACPDGSCSCGSCSLAPTHIAWWSWLRTAVIHQCSCCTYVHAQHCITFRDWVAHAHRFRRLRSIASRIVLLGQSTHAPTDPTAHVA